MFRTVAIASEGERIAPARTGLEQDRPIALAPAERAIGAFAVVLV